MAPKRKVPAVIDPIDGEVTPVRLDALQEAMPAAPATVTRPGGRTKTCKSFAIFCNARQRRGVPIDSKYGYLCILVGADQRCGHARQGEQPDEVRRRIIREARRR